MTTILKVATAAQREAAGAALRAAGMRVVEVEDWNAAVEAARRDEGALLVCDGRAVADLAAGAGNSSALTREASRSLSHDLRTPLSAMAGWVHLLESGKLDAAGVERAIGKLRGNIDDQVRTIERYLGGSKQEKSPS